MSFVEAVLQQPEEDDTSFTVGKLNAIC